MKKNVLKNQAEELLNSELSKVKGGQATSSMICDSSCLLGCSPGGFWRTTSKELKEGEEGTKNER